MDIKDKTSEKLHWHLRLKGNIMLNMIKRSDAKVGPRPIIIIIIIIIIIN